MAKWVDRYCKYCIYKGYKRKFKIFPKKIYCFLFLIYIPNKYLKCNYQEDTKPLVEN